MSFWISSKNKTSFFVQIIQWASTSILLFLWGQKKYKILPSVEVQLEYIFIEQLFFYNLMVITRGFIIAVRYGFASTFRLSMLTSKKQDFNYIAQDLLIPTWMNFNPHGLDLEIEAAMWRNQIEEQTFKFNFIEDINTELKMRLSNPKFYSTQDQNFEMS